MKIDIKKLVISILIPLVIGGISAIFTYNAMDSYDLLTKPAFSPPNILFPIVWTILFILMGISSYMIYTSNDEERGDALRIYGIQLVLNFFWSIIFFSLELRLVSFVWIILLIIAVIVMIVRFLKINKTAGYLQIPYLLWLLFAAVLNLSIYLLNR